MPPGGGTSQFTPHFGEIVPRTRQAECLPYSKDEVHSEIAKHQFAEQLSYADKHKILSK